MPVSSFLNCKQKIY